MVVGLLGNESPDLNRFILVTPKSENDVRLQATIDNQNPAGLPVGVVSIGSNLPYARKMEFGGSKVKAPNGYLRIAITEHLDQYKNAIATALKQIKDAGK